MKAFVPIKLDKMRNLRYGMRSLVAIERKIGKPMAQIDMDTLTIEEMMVIIWAGLQHEDKELTVEGVMDLIDEYSNITEVSQKMAEAMQAAFDSGEATLPKNGKKAAKKAKNLALME